MKHLFVLILFLIPLLSPPSFSLAQEASARNNGGKIAAKTADALPGSSPEEVYQTSKKAWLTALELRPSLVPLQGDASSEDSGQKKIESRLKVLETKIFSNREWRSYWELQATTAQDLSSAMGKLPPKVLKRIDGKAIRREGLNSWAQVASEKVINQDAFFAAIQQDKDALEARLEILLEHQGESIEAPVLVEDPSPYEQRNQKIVELEYLIAIQLSKQTIAEEKISFLSREGEGTKALLIALNRDLALAEKELSVASTQVKGAARDGLLPTWREIGTLAKAKVKGMRSELSLMSQRERVFVVEKTILGSEVDFRKKRLNSLHGELEDTASNERLMEVIRSTVWDWVTTRAPRILLIFLLTWVGVKIALRLLKRGTNALMEASDGEDSARKRTLVSTFSGVVRLVVYLLAALMALEQLGFNTDAIMGSAAIFGLAISFGAKNLVQDVVNGFFILLENQFAVGELVEIAGKTGHVQEITIRTTWLRHGATGDIYAIPNGSISGVRVHSREWGRAHCHIGVSYSADLDHVEKVIAQVGKEMREDPEWRSKLLDTPFMQGVTDLADSCIVVRIRAQTTPEEHWPAERELRRRCKKAFEEAGIGIPFPQVVLHKAEAES